MCLVHSTQIEKLKGFHNEGGFRSSDPVLPSTAGAPVLTVTYGRGNRAVGVMF